MIEDVVFAVRESPDWAGLAADHAAGRPIDPRRFAEPRDIPSFPTDIASLIGQWNELAAVDFFTCRRRLKDIAAAVLAPGPGRHVVSHADLPALLSFLRGRSYLVFFCDDDDWFAPDLLGLLASRDLAGADVVVFPLVRFELESFTLAAPGRTPPVAIGPCNPFVLRYHTNNYGLAPSACATPLDALREHRSASMAADRLGFTDLYVDRIISATNKTPCSASLLRAVVVDAGRFEPGVKTYLRNLKRLVIPDALAWMRAPLWDTIRLFETVVSGRRRR